MAENHKSLAKMSDEELISENEALMEEKAGVGLKQAELQAEMSMRALEAKKAAFLEGLNEQQRSIMGVTAIGSGGSD